MEEGIILKDDKAYPRPLKEISDAPKQLYYKGKWNSEIFENCLAVVGSRRMTVYGRQVVERFITEIAMAGITIVSGFMYGIDAGAHRAALRAGGRTIAVMPCGIDIISPEYQKDLYFEILNNNGLIVSEFEKDLAPALWTYPKRNRIVAGLSQACLVVEAGEKSGSLITARLANKYKRKLFAVPGPVTSENSKGTLQLIKEGAQMAISAKDVLRYYIREHDMAVHSVLPTRPSASPHPNPSIHSHNPALLERNLERKIIENLQREPLGIDILSRNLKVPIAKLGTVLSLMQIHGIISKQGNKYYVD
ncbi:DNA-processing protein DprA [Candidatus Parcubacteria bacterium]|nr:DNA-processing protein DprA [Candidatus Parcubacteria bacterium]